MASRWLLLAARATALGSRNKALVLLTKLVARCRMAAANLAHK